MAFADEFNMAYIMEHDLLLINVSFTPLTIFTNSLSLFNVLTDVSATTKTHMKIHLQNVQFCYCKMGIEDVAYIKFEFNIADALKNSKANINLLKSIGR